MFKFLHLPNELQVEILGHLDFVSLLKCSSVCKAFNLLVTTSSDIQYGIELSLNGMERIAGSSRPQSELLAELRKRRLDWDNLRWVGPTKVEIFGRCKAYELVGGVFAKTSGEDMMYVHLPTQTKETWTNHNTNMGIHIRDFAIDPSLDLVAILEENGLYNSSNQEHQVRIHFRTINENKPHPQAKSPLILFPLPPDEITGNALDSATLFLHSDVFCLLINLGEMLRVVLWNWMSGTMLYDSYSDPSNPTLPLFAADFCLMDRDSFMVLDSAASGAIHLYRFSPTSPAGCTHVATLALPLVSPHHIVSNMSVHSSQYEGLPRQLDYRTNQATRIHVIGMQYRKRFEGRDTTVMFSLFVPNDHLAKYLSDYSLSPSITPKTVLWDEWGPQNTRLMGRNVPIHWLRYVHGRMVACEIRGEEMKFLDFSVKPLPESALVDIHPRSHSMVIRSAEETRSRSPFLNQIKTSLPYRSICRQEKAPVSDYMIDEDRIIGIELGNDMQSMALHVYVIQ